MKKNHSRVKTKTVGNIRLLPHAKMLLVPMTFFWLWRVDYTSEENVLIGSISAVSRVRWAHFPEQRLVIEPNAPIYVNPVRGECGQGAGI